MSAINSIGLSVKNSITVYVCNVFDLLKTRLVDILFVVLKKLIITLMVALVDLLWLGVRILGVCGSVVGIVALCIVILVWCRGMRLMIIAIRRKVLMIILGRGLS
jgi:hypothetical protein